VQKITSYIFVYGTLLNKENEFAANLAANCTFVSHGKFKGKLYDVGEYPGAVSVNENDCYVYGSIFQLNKPQEILKILDGYEGFGDGQPQPNLFIRELVEVEADNKTFMCWVYLYNLPVEGLRQIMSGDYLEYTKTGRLTKF